MKLHLLLSVCLSIISSLSAQKNKIRIERFENLTDVQSLVLNGENIWLETYSSFAQLDTNGRVLRTFNENNSLIQQSSTFIIGEKGELFIQGRHNRKLYLLRWDKSTEQWTKFFTLKGYDAELPNKYTKYPQLWVYNDKYLFRFKDEKWHRYPIIPEKNIRHSTIIQNDKGEIYLKDDKKFFLYDGKKWQQLPTPKIAPEDLFFAHLSLYQDTIYVDANQYWDGNTWQPTNKWKNIDLNEASFFSSKEEFFFMKKEQLVRYHKDQTQQINIPARHFQDLGLSVVYSADAKGRIYIANKRGKLFKKNGNEWQDISPEQTNKIGKVSDELFFSASGSVWTSSNRQIAVFENERFSILPDSLFQDEKYAQDKVHASQFIETSTGSFYMLSGSDIYKRLPSGQWDLYFTDNLEDAALYGYLHSKGHLCTINKKGAHQEFFDNGDIVLTHIPELKELGVFAQEFSSPKAGECWIQPDRQDKIYQIQDAKAKLYNLPADSSKTKNEELIFDLHVADSFIYLRQHYRKFWRLHIASGEWTNLNVPEELFSNSCHTHLDANNQLWAGSMRRHLYQYKGGKWVKQTQGGLKRQKIYGFIFVDSRSRLWVQGKDICVFDLKDNCRRLASMPSPYDGDLTIYEDKKGHIWLTGSYAGIFRLTLP